MNALLKRLCSFALSMALACSTLPAAFAAEEALLSVGSGSGKAGSNVTLNVNIADNPGVSGAGLDVSYDRTALELTAMENKTDGSFVTNLNTGKLAWLLGSNRTTDGVLFTLTFQIKSAAVSGTYPVAVSLTGGTDNNFVNEDAQPVPVRFQAGSVTVEKASSGGDSGSTVTTYTLTFDTNGGSSIAKISNASGTTISLSGYKPTREGYDFAGWYSDSALTNKITTVKLTANTTVYAKWAVSEQVSGGFTDVPASAYYKDAVDWAVKNGVTSGTSATTFEPNGICTRAQTVTFLWRAMGSPEPTTTNNPFADVNESAYYYKAVLWAVEKGITVGTSATIFSPDMAVTRAQTVTFLHRTAGTPAATVANPFTDVQGSDYFANAVLWAVEKGITEGVAAASFAPNDGCTRAQIVTFLYRNFGK